jgi:hypothetical protein
MAMDGRSGAFPGVGPGTVRPGARRGPGTAFYGAKADRTFGSGSLTTIPTSFHPTAKDVSFGVSGGPESLPRNQRGGVLGGEWVWGIWSGRVNATLAQFPEAMGNGANTDPIAPSQGRYLLADQRWAVQKDVEFRLMFQETSGGQISPRP